jgi:hypothetical protein
MSGWLVEGRETLKPKAKAKQNKSDDVDGKKGGKERVIWVLIHSIPKQKPSCHMMTNDLWGGMHLGFDPPHDMHASGLR